MLMHRHWHWHYGVILLCTTSFWTTSVSDDVNFDRPQRHLALQSNLFSVQALITKPWRMCFYIIWSLCGNFRNFQGLLQDAKRGERPLLALMSWFDWLATSTMMIILLARGWGCKDAVVGFENFMSLVTCGCVLQMGTKEGYLTKQGGIIKVGGPLFSCTAF